MDILLDLAQLECLDITPPLALGEDREMLFFPAGYPSWRMSRSTALGHVPPEQGVALRDSYESRERGERRALDW